MSLGYATLPNITIGADPELFVVNQTGKFVSAAGLIPGTKAVPYKVPGGAVQVDGMAAEFNIDPVNTFEDFDNNITMVMKELKKMLPKGYRLESVPAVTFDEDVWDAAPDEAKELGCTPDFNAWTNEVNPPPSLPDNPRLRTASGHLHIGWTEDADTNDVQHIVHCTDLVKQLDWYLGGWSLSVDPDPVRRQLYGKAGACRYKPYGVEYRVLSNFWLNTKDRRLNVWNRLNRAISDMRSVYMPEKASLHNKLLIESINSSQRSSAFEQKYNFPVRSIS